MKGDSLCPGLFLSTLSYVQAFSISCSPVQGLLAIKTPINVPDSETFPSFNPANKSLLNLLLPRVSRFLVLLTLLVSSIFLKDFPHHGVKALLANSGLMAILALGSTCSLPVG
jgi:hypothetical protein